MVVDDDTARPDSGGVQEQNEGTAERRHVEVPEPEGWRPIGFEW